MRVRAQAKQERRRRHLQLETCDELANNNMTGTMEIPVYLHLTSFLVDAMDGGTAELIPHPTDKYIQLVSDGDPPLIEEFSTQADIEALFADNLVVLNDAFIDTPFTFRWVNTTVTANLDYMVDVANYTNGFGSSIGIKDLSALNVYVGLRVDDLDLGTLGLATFPASQR